MGNEEPALAHSHFHHHRMEKAQRAGGTTISLEGGPQGRGEGRPGSKIIMTGGFQKGDFQLWEQCWEFESGPRQNGQRGRKGIVRVAGRRNGFKITLH